MAQKDAKINIELAKDTSLLARLSIEDSHVMKTIAIESKRDSSAMKTIAMLTMLFLPGTFLAVSLRGPSYYSVKENFQNFREFTFANDRQTGSLRNAIVQLG